MGVIKGVGLVERRLIGLKPAYMRCVGRCALFGSIARGQWTYEGVGECVVAIQPSPFHNSSLTSPLNP